MHSSRSAPVDTGPETAHTVPPTRSGEPTASAPGAGARLRWLDALRGFALCGILLVNVPQVLSMRGITDGEKHVVRHVLDMFVQQRFFPLFSLLFGVSFALVLHRAQDSTPHPRWVLARRSLVLAGLGALHQLLHPGEALLFYGVGGLLILLPLSWTPLWLHALLAGGLTVTGLTAASGGLALVPGALGLGFLLGRSGVVYRLGRAVNGTRTAFVVSLVLSTSALLWQEQDPLSAGFNHSSAVAGVCLALTYATGLLLVLRTRAGRRLSPVLETLGRMALTNYVSATLLFVPLGHLLGLWDSSSWLPMLALCAAILTAQWAFGRIWLARFRYGPLEWGWRCLTWWRVVELRRTPAASD
ncbi:DUF418 domain-containing protein [Actinopolyspora mortivallis]|uniref:DUF418 domain-containing protein n=1 Tax=Actinopolyspora mortivallis TaxID=33906 RepID=A0A2T0H1I5_ACTMO|nr:DUF418 domain-containing protein [Actinopolyspora mortivallis]PRW65113.1 hypothetical protein CEP50_00850 [Actinopolyspora mortivallis]